MSDIREFAVMLLARIDALGVEAMPWAAHILAIGGIAAGGVLWVAGRKLMRPAYALAGALIGGAFGFFLLPQATPALFNVPSPYLGLAVGAGIGLLAGVTLFRFAVAVSNGATFALAGALVAAAIVGWNPGLLTPAEPATPETPWTTAIGPQEAAPPPDPAEAIIQGIKPTAEKVRLFVVENAGHLRASWGALPEQDRFSIATAALGAGLCGFFLALFALSRSMLIASAVMGSGIVLVCGVWLWRASEAPGQKYLDQGPMVWAAVWGAAALLGALAQLRGGLSKQKAATGS